MNNLTIKRFSLLLIGILISCKVNAQNRVERPLQIHLNGNGLFLKAFGNKLSDSEINQLDIKKWSLPGLSIGYHINKKWYLGYAYHPNRNFILKEPWSFGKGENDGNVDLDHNTGSFHTIEGRYFPFDFGLYGAAFLTHTTKAKYSMQFVREYDDIEIGENRYNTDINATWDFKSLSTIGIGIGYNYVHPSRISFDLGLGMPITFANPLYENININATQGITIIESDIALATEKIENELFYFPIQMHVNIGYNFN